MEMNDFGAATSLRATMFIMFSQLRKHENVLNRLQLGICEVDRVNGESGAATGS
jgi:hypothetical protein